MPDPDPHDDTSADYEQFEQALLAQDRDVAGVDTADVDDATARAWSTTSSTRTSSSPVPEDSVLVHEPSGAAFDSATQLAVYHRGWTAGRNADEEGE